MGDGDRKDGAFADEVIGLVRNDIVSDKDKEPEKIGKRARKTKAKVRESALRKITRMKAVPVRFLGLYIFAVCVIKFACGCRCLCFMLLFCERLI